jgi:hypothetical protein
MESRDGKISGLTFFLDTQHAYQYTQARSTALSRIRSRRRRYSDPGSSAGS